MKKELGGIEIGVSIVCYLPWSAYFPNLAAKWAKEGGFYFLAVLPLRRLGYSFKPEIPVRFLEQAWNPVDSLLEVVRRQPTKKGYVPGVENWAFFPSPEKSKRIFNLVSGQYPNSRETVHFLEDLSGDRLLEVSPKLGITPSDIIKAIEAKGYPKCLVLDLYHLRRQAGEVKGEKPGTSLLGPWQESLLSLLPYTSLIHVQPYRNRGELERIMAGEKCTELEKMLRVIKESGYSGPYLVEATIGLKGWNAWKLRRMLQRMREFIKNVE